MRVSHNFCETHQRVFMAHAEYISDDPIILLQIDNTPIDHVGFVVTSTFQISFNMMTSSDGNIFHVTGPSCGEFTGPR